MRACLRETCRPACSQPADFFRPEIFPVNTTKLLEEIEEDLEELEESLRPVYELEPEYDMGEIARLKSGKKGGQSFDMPQFSQLSR